MLRRKLSLASPGHRAFTRASKTHNSSIAVLVAQHPQAPGDLLVKIHKNFPQEDVSAALRARKSYPVELADLLAREFLWSGDDFFVFGHTNDVHFVEAVEKIFTHTKLNNPEAAKKQEKNILRSQLIATPFGERIFERAFIFSPLMFVIIDNLSTPSHLLSGVYASETFKGWRKLYPLEADTLMAHPNFPLEVLHDEFFKDLGPRVCAKIRELSGYSERDFSLPGRDEVKVGEFLESLKDSDFIDKSFQSVSLDKGKVLTLKDKFEFTLEKTKGLASVLGEENASMALAALEEQDKNFSALERMASSIEASPASASSVKALKECIKKMTSSLEDTESLLESLMHVAHARAELSSSSLGKVISVSQAQSQLLKDLRSDLLL